MRDQIKYDPFHMGLAEDDYRASRIAGRPSNFCVPKAILLTAALRAAGIPAAVGFADVKNHLNSPKLSDLMGTDLFIYHGYVALWLKGRMFKVTPAFNTELCQRFGVRELIFDGEHDALFHEFDTRDHRHMEYVNDRGWFADPPIAQLLREFRATYPKLVALSASRDSDQRSRFQRRRDDIEAGARRQPYCGCLAYCTAIRPTFSRAMTSFWICAVPSPICRPITSR